MTTRTGKILVTGSKGQLGHDVTKELKLRNFVNVCGIDIDEVDLTNETNTKKFVREFHPDVIIHNAAWTNVDKAEEDFETAKLINAAGTENIAKVCGKLDIPLSEIPIIECTE